MEPLHESYRCAKPRWRDARLLQSRQSAKGMEGVQEMNPDCCRVCGYDIGGGWDGSQPLYVICSCCGAESGLDDAPEDVAAAFFSEWVSVGCPWWDTRARPAGWSLVRQLVEADNRQAMATLKGLDEGVTAPKQSKSHPFSVSPWWRGRR